MNSSAFWWLFLGCMLVYILGMPIDIMDVDSAQYASISREMAENGSFLQVMSYGRDYLDKPPLLFWVTALFFKTLGYANWTFKLGSFLFSLLGVFSTYKLGKLLYDKAVGRLSAIILFSCQAFFLFNNDVRTDTILVSSVIFAIWQWTEWLHERKNWKWLVGAAIGIACAMMAKGPIGIMVPVLAMGSYMLGRRAWKEIFRWEYLLLIGMVALLLAPMLYGLYQQFDLHPEKSVPMVTPDGIKYEKGVSGLKFYLWTQSFGRITGENVWENGTGPFFFVHNFLWSFLPWALLFIIAFFDRIINVFQSLKNRLKTPELLTLGGFILPFLALSLSRYKLPHYIFVCYPLAAILLGSWIVKVRDAGKSGVKYLSLALQILVAISSSAIAVIIYFWFFPDGPWLFPFLSFIFILAGLVYFLKFKHSFINLIIASVLTTIAVNIAMNGRFYPSLLQYQAGSNSAFAIQSLGLPEEDVYNYGFSSFSYYYYRGSLPKPFRFEAVIKKMKSGEDVFVVCRGKHLQKLQKDFNTRVLHQFGSHSVTLLNIAFLNPKSREETLETMYVVQLTSLAKNAAS